MQKKFKCIFGWFEWNFAEVKTNDLSTNRKEILPII
jgi:hypothetical protein